ncbi:MAG: hypothetical protein ABSA46_13495 [Thermodesulfovibrionales bacterium]
MALGYGTSMVSRPIIATAKKRLAYHPWSKIYRQVRQRHSTARRSSDLAAHLGRRCPGFEKNAATAKMAV